MKDKEPLNLIISGVGGQGNILISRLIGQALVKRGHYVTIGETYGASQRGGAVMSHVRVSRESEYSPIIPYGNADIILSLEPMETLRVLAEYGNPRVNIVTNLRPVYPLPVSTGEAEYPSMDKMREMITQLSHKAWFVNASDIALELGAAIVANMVMTGALVATGVTPLSSEMFEEELRETMSGERLKLNLLAFSRGYKILKDVF